jgi:hypothetical protein
MEFTSAPKTKQTRYRTSRYFAIKLIKDISWLSLFLSVHFSNHRFRAENLFNRPHHFVLCSDFPRAAQSLSNEGFFSTIIRH